MVGYQHDLLKVMGVFPDIREHGMAKVMDAGHPRPMFLTTFLNSLSSLE